ncbi:MAG TPA: fibronectin type III domain-containing protein [Planctomycetaceae bacterium]|nr:fibronectin type III domain-containing protein [Planctomycetaceae bacterium]
MSVVLILAAWTSCVVAADIAPPTDLVVKDRQNDAANGLIVTWTLSADDAPDVQPKHVMQYEIARQSGDTEWSSIANIPAGNDRFEDTNCEPGKRYRYRVITVSTNGDKSAAVESTEAMQPVMNWIDTRRLWFGGIVAFICGSVIVCTELAKRGMGLYVRPIAALTALDEAVGRATEMGRPMLFVPGLMDLDQIETVAGLTVLSKVAKTAAEYDAALEVPTSRSLVMTAAQESCEAACLEAGRPESFNPDRIYYVTDEQFGYVAYVCGWMTREKPAACFFLGKFFAESLLLAETGNGVGAIQIAGTAEAPQLPFFVAACDYTLIGEELFAASAYLSREPQQLGTLKGQDAGKVLAAALLLGGCLLATWAALQPNSPGATMNEYFREVILNKGEA